MTSTPKTRLESLRGIRRTAASRPRVASEPTDTRSETNESTERTERVGRLLALDPGFDVTGWAVFKPTPWRPATLNHAIVRLDDSGIIKTSPSDTDPARLTYLAAQVVALVYTWDPSLVVVEMPSYAGLYSKGRERQAGVAKLYMAIGAILGRLGDRQADVELVRASRERKAERHELLACAARVAGIELPAGPRGGERPDTWDAIWLGATALLRGGCHLV